MRKSYWRQDKERWDLNTLTLDCIDYTVTIFDQLFQGFACPLQLQLITLQSLSEVRTVQIAVTELQGRMPHLLSDWVQNNGNCEFVLVSSPNAHCSLLLSRSPHSHLSVGACGSRGSDAKWTTQRGAAVWTHFPPFLRRTRYLSAYSSVSWSSCHFSLLWWRAATIPAAASHSERHTSQFHTLMKPPSVFYLTFYSVVDF